MKSFNAYGQTAESFGGNIPVWLGTVKPVPVGAVLEESYVKAGALYKAGTPVEYNAAARTFKPMANAEDATVNPNGYLYNDIYIDKVGTDTAATGAIVVNHPEGLLIDRTEFASIKATLVEKIPGVYLVSDMTA
jgi:hypothetical protein